MSIAHEGSQLPIQDYIIPVDYQDRLFPFYWNTVSGRGDEPLSNVTTFVRDEKFGQVLAVEEGTTNIGPNQGIDFTSIWSHQHTPVPTYTKLIGEKFFDLNPVRVNITATGGYLGFDKSSIPTINVPWTFSVYVRPQNRTMNLRLSTDEAAPPATICRQGVWTRLTITFSPAAAYRWLVLNGWQTGDIIDIVCPQLEQKSWATSFVNGTRTAGILSYDKSIIPIGDFTINMWVANTGDTRVGSLEYKFLALGMTPATAMLTMWNYYPISTDPNVTAPNGRRLIADFGNNAAGTRQYNDWIMETFIPNQWEMVTITFNRATRRFTFYRNGQSRMTYIPGELKQIDGLFLYNSGWKYSNLMIAPRILTDDEINTIYQYGKPLYDPYNYYSIYG